MDTIKPALALCDLTQALPLITFMEKRMPHPQAVGEATRQHMQVQSVTSTARKLALPIKFQNVVT